MLTFSLLAILLVIVTVFVLLLPLLRPRESDSHERHAQNIHFARERLTELDQQLKTAAISASDYEALKLEIEATLAEDIDLAELEKAKQDKDTGSTSNAVLITLLCCLVPVVAAGVYFLTGSPKTLLQPPMSAAPASSTQGAEIGNLVLALEERLKSEPEDIQGWSILARTYQQLGRYPESLAAYQTLLKLQPDSADVYAGLADATAAMADGNLSGQAGTYVMRALALDPQHPQSLWLAGLMQLQQGNNSQALGYWQQLMPLLDGFPDQQAELQSVMNQTSNTAQTNSATEELTEQAISEQRESTSTASLNLSVQIDSALADAVEPSDVVFVIARAKSGPPAPLAVKRLRVSDLPTTVSLSAADAMLPQLSIDAFADLEVVARVSKSGQPIAQSGDLQSVVVNTSNDNSELIELLIDSPVK